MSGLTDTEREALAEAHREPLAKFISEHLFGYRDGPYMNHEAMAATLIRSEPFQRLIIAAREQGRADLAAALAHVVRDHDMPQKKDQHGYDYRMGWWDAVVQADRIIRGGLRVCEDCPGKPSAADSTPREDQP